MTNKQAFINAIEKLERPTLEFETCKLCQLAGKKSGSGEDKCWPCPFADKNGNERCFNSAYMMDVLLKRGRIFQIKVIRNEIIKMLEALPDERFTNKGWKCNWQLFRYLDKLYEEYMGKS